MYAKNNKFKFKDNIFIKPVKLVYIKFKYKKYNLCITIRKYVAKCWLERLKVGRLSLVQLRTTYLLGSGVPWKTLSLQGN